MEAIKIAVCDDEKNIRSYICSLVRKQGVECEVTEYATAEDYLLARAECDLLFLDVELKGPDSSMDGMEMAKRIRGMEDIKQPVIIFVTGYEKYVYDAFDVGAFQYLLKPIDEGRFAEIFQRAAQQAGQGKRVLMIQYGNTGKTIPLSDIYYMESQNHKIAVHMKDGVLEYYAKMSYLVNLSYVDEYNKTEVTLTNGDKLLISKYKYEDFVKAYLRFMK